MHGSGVLNEVEASPGVAGKKFGGEKVPFEAIAATTGGYEIAGRMLATFGEWEDVVDGGEVEIEWCGAIHTAAPAVTHHCVFDRALLVAHWRSLAALGAASDSWKAWQANMVIVSTP